MADQLPINFAIPGENVVVSYNWEDVANGDGYVRLYASASTQTSTTTYFLINQTIDSDLISTGGEVTSSSSTKILDMDFDLSQFNAPRKIIGSAIVSATLGKGTTASGSNTGEAFFIAKIRKWNGTTESEIANSQSRTIILPATTSATGEPKSERLTTKVTIPETSFKIGETLRLTMEVWAKKTDTNNFTISLAHDPTGRKTGSTSDRIEDEDVTTLILNMPFKINSQ